MKEYQVKSNSFFDTPCERDYNRLQVRFDWEIVKLLSSILDLGENILTSPFASNFQSFDVGQDDWILTQITNGTAEISSESLVLTNDTPRVCQYSFGIDTFRPQLYFRGKSLREEKNIYRAPFSTEVWISFAVVVALLTLVLTFVLSRETELPHEISYDVFARMVDVQEDRDDDWADDDSQNATEESLHQREKWEVGEILLVCLGALCQQGSARDPSTHAARILLLVLFLLAALFNTFYSASVIGFISHWPSTEREQNFHFHNLSSENLLIHQYNNIEKLPELGIKHSKKTTLEWGFNKALTGEAIFIGDRDESLTFFNHQNFGSDLRCKLGRAYLGVEYQRVLSLKKNSTYKEKVNYNSILRLKEFGLLRRIKTNIFQTNPPCSKLERSTTTGFVTFNKNDVWPAQRIFLMGLLLSIFILLGEKFICLQAIHKVLVSFVDTGKMLLEKNL